MKEVIELISKRIQIVRFCLLLGSLFLCVSSIKAVEWHEKVNYLIYSPRYFGPNAFPIPELLGGSLSNRWEVELRGEYYRMQGDKTKDIFTSLYIPVVKGRVGVNVSWVFQEWYEMSPEVRDERYAVELKSPIVCRGDVIFNFYFQALRSEKWMDIVVSANLKTASGGRLCDARYTDAASYWFDANLGHTLWKRKDVNASIRVQALAGFYCWMTNDVVHRQNDAFCYGAGVLGTYRGLSLDCNYAGFRGYRNNGDKPGVLRIKMSYGIGRNIISYQYKYGVKDFCYNSYSLAYIRCF